MTPLGVTTKCDDTLCSPKHTVPSSTETVHTHTSQNKYAEHIHHSRVMTRPERRRINRAMRATVLSLKQQVLVRLLCQNVGRLGDGTQLSQAGGDLQLRPLPGLLLLLLDLLQPGKRGEGEWFSALEQNQKAGAERRQTMG